MKRIYKNIRIVTCDDAFTIYDGGMIGIDGETIAYVGAQDDAYIQCFGADEVIDGNDNIVMPGLINAHTHLAMTLFRGLGSDLPLREWLEEKIWPAEARLVENDCRIGSLMGIAEMLKSGTTAFLDMYFNMHETAEAALQTGIKAVLTTGVMGDTYKDRLDTIQEQHKDYHNAGNGQIQIMIAPHAEYTNTKESLKACIRAANKLQCGLHIHVSETEREVKECYERHGVSPVKYLADVGVFDVHAIAAHCVAVDDNDIAILRDKGVHIAHNPTSNMKLSSGCAPVQQMLDTGINVALGTDGCASNNNLDMLEEMHIAALIAKGFTGDPAVLNAQSVIKMATIGGAKALGIDHMTGSLEPGKRADMIMLDGQSILCKPRSQWLNHLVYSMGRSEVKMTMADGKVLLENGVYTTLDIEKIKKEYDQVVQRLIVG